MFNRIFSILVLVSVLLATPALATFNLAPIGSLVIGGMGVTTTGLKILKCSIGGTTNSVCYDVSVGGTPGVYQVPGGKTFKLEGVKLDALSASAASGSVRLFYADNNVGVDSGTAMVNAVGLISGSGSGTVNAEIDAVFSQQLVGTTQKEIACGGSAPAAKFIVVQISGGGAFGMVWLYGYEV